MASTTSLENDAGCVAGSFEAAQTASSSDTARRGLEHVLAYVGGHPNEPRLAVLVVVERHLIGKRVLQKRVLKGILGVGVSVEVQHGDAPYRIAVPLYRPLDVSCRSHAHRPLSLAAHAVMAATVTRAVVIADAIAVGVDVAGTAAVAVAATVA